MLKKVIFIVFCISTFILESAGAETLPTSRPNLDPLKVAHRGTRIYAPENTIPSIENAIKLGFDYLEMDVRYTKDGIPVLMHDERVNRTTDGDGYVRDFTAAEIVKLDASAGFMSDPEKFKGTTVPTLEDALKVMQGRIKLYLDQKEPSSELTISLLEKYGFLPDNIVVVGGVENQVAFRALAPRAPVMPPAKDIDEMKAMFALFGDPYAFNTTCPNVSADMIDYAHEHGALVFTNTLNFCDNQLMMKKMLELGPDAIQTDMPIDLLKLLKKLNRQKNGGAI